MAQLIRLTPELRADFVAYLDGELDEQDSERIETALAQSNVARKDVEDLARTYEMLDVLPRYDASDEFTEQTMATVRVSDVHQDYRETKWFQAVRSGSAVLAWMAALVGVIAGGFVATHQWVSTDGDALIRDLPVIERLDTYAEVGSMEFLERLNRQPALLKQMTPEGDNTGAGL